jgi:hypothetical protein
MCDVLHIRLHIVVCVVSGEGNHDGTTPAAVVPPGLDANEQANVDTFMQRYHLFESLFNSYVLSTALYTNSM